MATLTINGKRVEVTASNETPLLWAIREELKLTGTKYGCGVASCGACTVHLAGKPVRSCAVTIGDVKGRPITTIEGLSPNGSHPLQKAWVAEQVPQCGYCQSGQIMQAAAVLKDNPNISDADIDAQMTGNLCRCMTYTRIRAAVRQAANTMKGG